MNSASIEAVLVAILLPNSKSILIGNLYRPPDQSHFYALLEGVLNDFGKPHGTEIIICGDLNTDMSNMDSVLYKAFKHFSDLD